MSDDSVLGYDPTLRRLVEEAGARLVDTIRRETPSLATRVLPWLGALSRTGQVADYFTHPRRFPMLLLPWWAAEQVGNRSDVAFHGNVVYSTMNAYYYVRLVDDAVDGTHRDLTLLPAAALFHTECVMPYLAFFGPEAPFWALYRTIWMRATDAAVDPVAPAAVDLASFADRAIRRIEPAFIPLAAVCHRGNRPELLEPWRAFVRDLCRIEQLLDDYTDWRHDAERGLDNLLLAEAGRHGHQGEDRAAWVVAEGLDWALGLALDWVAAARSGAIGLGCPDPIAYLDYRRGLIVGLGESIRPGVAAYRALDSAFRRGDS